MVTPRQTSARRDGNLATARLVAELLKGLESGKPVEFKVGHFNAKKQELMRRAGKPQR